MKYFFILFCFFFSWKAAGFEIYNKSRPSVEGAQIFVLDPIYEGRLEDFFRELKEKKTKGATEVDAVFLRVFHNKGDRVHLGGRDSCPEGGVYFATNNACVVEDILAECVKYAKKYDIKLFAWMATRSLSFLKTPDNMSLSFAPNGDKVAGYGANIFKPEVRSALLSLFSQLAEYDIDGILIQDDFIIKYAEGADRFACAEFSRKTGIACRRDEFFYPSNGALGKRKEAYDSWNRWKAEALSELFLEIRRKVRLINPKLLWAVNIYYETPVFADKGLLWYSHDMDSFLLAGADYLAVMAYHEQIAQEMKFGEAGTLNYLKDLAAAAVKVAGTERSIFKVQVRRFDTLRTPIDAKTVNAVRKAIITGGGTNFIKLPVNAP
jgi:biofilm PGA synthesis lipoprotein PgaB